MSSSNVKIGLDDSPMEWLWESYKIALNTDNAYRSNINLDKVLYTRDVSTAVTQLQKAGIHLATLLNKIYN